MEKITNTQLVETKQLFQTRLMKLGKEADPKLSRLIKKSDAVVITDVRELRVIDKCLRLK